MDVKRPDNVWSASSNDHVLSGHTIRETGKQIENPTHLPPFGDAAPGSFCVLQQWLTRSDRQSECSVSSELMFAIPAIQRVVFRPVPWSGVSVWSTAQVFAPRIRRLEAHSQCRPQSGLPFEGVVVVVAQVRSQERVPELRIRVNEIVIHIDMENVTFASGDRG